MLFRILTFTTAILTLPITTIAWRPCVAPITWKTLNAEPETQYTQRDIDEIDSGEGCCNLCWLSMENCVAAEWNQKKTYCRVYTNESWNLKENITATCPNGQFRQGEVRDPSAYYTGFYIGPCWQPSYRPPRDKDWIVAKGKTWDEWIKQYE